MVTLNNPNKILENIDFHSKETVPVQNNKQEDITKPLVASNIYFKLVNGRKEFNEPKNQLEKKQFVKLTTVEDDPLKIDFKKQYPSLKKANDPFIDVETYTQLEQRREILIKLAPRLKEEIYKQFQLVKSKMDSKVNAVLKQEVLIGLSGEYEDIVIDRVVDKLDPTSPEIINLKSTTKPEIIYNYRDYRLSKLLFESNIESIINEFENEFDELKISEQVKLEIENKYECYLDIINTVNIPLKTKAELITKLTLVYQFILEQTK